MYNFTHNNHLKHFIDGKLFGTRTNKYQQYTTDVGTVDPEYYAKSNYQLELLRVARLQYDEYKGDMALYISGGTDSEIMARSFARQGIKPKCIIIRFIGDSNIDEVREAVAVANELSLPYEIIDFDVWDFYKSGAAADLAVKIQCELLPFLVFFQVAKKLGTASILGGELLVEKYINNDFKPEWVLRNIETLEAAHVRFAMKYEIPFVIEWFSYTPELMLYYLEDHEVKDLIADKTPFWSITPVKNKILKRLVPDLRIKEKTTGYENLKGLLIDSKVELAKLMPENIGDVKPYLTYNEVISKLKGEHA